MKKKIKKAKIETLVKKESKELLWAGAKDLFNQYGSEKDKVKRDSLIVVSQALKITPFGVNLLGGLPYINNIGLKQKSLEQYHKGANLEYNWVKRSENDDDKAICEARIAANGKPLKAGGKDMPWIVGEASPASMKMGTLKGYQNHMAQTRAENRAIRYVDGLRIHKELIEEIIRMRSASRVDDRTATEAAQAASVSIEEMSGEFIKSQKQLPILPAKTEKSDPVQLAANFIKNTRVKSSLDVAEKRVKANVEFNESNKNYLLALINTQRKRIKI